MMECSSDEETASLLANSYSEEEIKKKCNSFNKDLLSFMAKRESKLMESVLK